MIASEECITGCRLEGNQMNPHEIRRMTCDVGEPGQQCGFHGVGAPDGRKRIERIFSRRHSAELEERNFRR